MERTIWCKWCHREALIRTGRLEAWSRRHPWRAAAVAAVILFVFGFALRTLAFNANAADAAILAGIYSFIFAVLSGVAWSHLYRHEKRP